MKSKLYSVILFSLVVFAMPKAFVFAQEATTTENGTSTPDVLQNLNLKDSLVSGGSQSMFTESEPVCLTVAGAGDEAVNGTYVVTGTHQTKPIYSNGVDFLYADHPDSNNWYWAFYSSVTDTYTIWYYRSPAYTPTIDDMPDNPADLVFVNYGHTAPAPTVVQVSCGGSPPEATSTSIMCSDLINSSGTCVLDTWQNIKRFLSLTLVFGFFSGLIIGVISLVTHRERW